MPIPESIPNQHHDPISNMTIGNPCYTEHNAGKLQDRRRACVRRMEAHATTGSGAIQAKACSEVTGRIHAEACSHRSTAEVTRMRDNPP